MSIPASRNDANASQSEIASSNVHPPDACTPERRERGSSNSIHRTIRPTHTKTVFCLSLYLGEESPNDPSSCRNMSRLGHKSVDMTSPLSIKRSLCHRESCGLPRIVLTLNWCSICPALSSLLKSMIPSLSASICFVKLSEATPFTRELKSTISCTFVCGRDLVLQLSMKTFSSLYCRRIPVLSSM